MIPKIQALSGCLGRTLAFARASSPFARANLAHSDDALRGFPASRPIVSAFDRGARRDQRESFIVVRARASDERDARIRSRSIATHRGVGDASDARERERIARDRVGSRATRAAVDDGEAATRWR